MNPEGQIHCSRLVFRVIIPRSPSNSNNYMNWEQIKEIEKEDFVFIGNHSHSHEYLVNYKFNDFKRDIDQSIKIFKKKLGYKFFQTPYNQL